MKARELSGEKNNGSLRRSVIGDSTSTIQLTLELDMLCFPNLIRLQSHYLLMTQDQEGGGDGRQK